MWRRPVGRAGSGPASDKGSRIKASDFDPHALPGCKVVDGRELPEEFITRMNAAKNNAPPPVNFVEQMRERKRNADNEEA